MISTLILLFIPVMLSAAGCIYVDLSNSGPAYDGSMENPYISIQAAIDIAQSGDTIKVAQGTYTGNITSYESRGFILLGGFQTGNFTNRNADNYNTIINGDGTAAVITIDYNGSGGDNQLYMIDGFTVGNGQRGIYVSDNGNGGVSRLLLSNNIIQNNKGLTDGGEYGGGVSCSGMIPEIRNNIIRNNSCGKSGGLAVVFHNTDYSFIIDGNLIENNSIYADHGAGAGVQAYKGVISNNRFMNNTILETYGWGGGLLVDGNMFTGFSENIFIELSNNTYSGNKAPSGGAGLYIDEGANVRMKNELITNNTGYNPILSGAFYIDGPRANGNAKTIAENITVADNTGAENSNGHAVFVEGGSEAVIRNSIFWGNQSPDNQNDFFVDETSSLVIDYSTYMSGKLGDGTFSITNSNNSDPQFANALESNYYLKSQIGRWDPLTQSWVKDAVQSPAIDAGEPGSQFNNEPAPNGGRVNLGCYGNTEYASKSNSTTVHNISDIDIKDFSIFPNPVLSKGSLSFRTLRGGNLRLEIRNSMGQIIEILADEYINSGEYKFEILTQKLSSGVYYCVLDMNGGSSSVKFAVIK